MLGIKPETLNRTLAEYNEGLRKKAMTVYSANPLPL